MNRLRLTMREVTFWNFASRSCRGGVSLLSCSGVITISWVAGSSSASVKPIVVLLTNSFTVLGPLPTRNHCTWKQERERENQTKTKEWD